MLELLAPRADRAVGIDLSPAMLPVARANLERAGVRNVQLRQGDIYALPVERNSCDLVLLHQVLHYLEDPGSRAARSRTRAGAGRAACSSSISRRTTKSRCAKIMRIAGSVSRRDEIADLSARCRPRLSASTAISSRAPAKPESSPCRSGSRTIRASIVDPIPAHTPEVA